MNTIPSELIAVPRYPGYFWHPEKQQLYSIKVTGELKPLTRMKAWKHCLAGFNVSHKGRPRRLGYDYLRALKPYNYEVPYRETRTRERPAPILWSDEP